MRYDAGQQNIVVTAGELTEVAARHLAGGDEYVPVCRSFPDPGNAVSLSAPAEYGGVRFLVTESVARQGDGVLLAFQLPPGADPGDDALLRRVRGEAFVAGYLLAETEDLASVSLHIQLFSTPDSEPTRLSEQADRKALTAFVRRALSALCRYERDLLDRVSRRLPTLRDAAFPHPSARPGQKSLMQTVYSAIKQGRTLFACAPTGTGKTVSTLFPAVRALGAGVCDKVFYLTPKTTSADMAAETISLLSSRGVLLRAVRLHAKEKWCLSAGGALPGEEHDCRRCRSNGMANGKLHETALALYAGDRALPTEREILAAATAAQLCPYELTLACADLADVVIGDYNYLFDPRVALRQYFAPGAAQGRRFAVLVDEAHNLPERARETYSVRLSRTAFSLLLQTLASEEDLLPKAEAALAVFDATLSAMLRDELRPTKDGGTEGFASQSNPPEAMIAALCRLSDDAMAFVTKNRRRQDDAMRAFRTAAYELCNIAETAAAYDDATVTYAMREDGEDTLCLYCIDPSARLSARETEVSSLVFFSATLSPPDYYRTVLGGDRTAITENVPSPFDPDRLCITVMDKISTRYSAREDTLSDVVKVILETLRGKRGNYMVFCPSFRYMEAVADLFHRAAPKIPYAVQKRHMTAAERERYLGDFREDRNGYFVGFAVMGGIYAEGIDLAGDRLIGAVVVGIGIPQLSPERAMIESYYQCKCDEGKEYAYLYPGMNRVLQAAGRVIRRETDRGVLVLIDERFRDPVYRKIIPSHWHGLRYAGDLPALREHIRRYWSAAAEEDAKARAENTPAPTPTEERTPPIGGEAKPV